jgi:hypothetical protein
MFEGEFQSLFFNFGFFFKIIFLVFLNCFYILILKLIFFKNILFNIFLNKKNTLKIITLLTTRLTHV